MYPIGAPFLLQSSFKGGARDDAQELVVELGAFLRQASATKH